MKYFMCKQYLTINDTRLLLLLSDMQRMMSHVSLLTEADSTIY